MSTNPVHNDNVYYNIQLTNNDETGRLFEARYQSEQTQVLLDNPSEFYLTIARFSVPGRNIPLMVFEVQDNQPDPNLGVYSVTLTFGADDYQTFTIYIPHVLNVPVPPSPIPVQIRSPYYYMFAYQNMIEFLNTALLTSFNALKAAHPGVVSTEAPYFIYNDSKISLVMPYSYITDNIDIYFNLATLQLFEAFEGFFIGANQPNGKNWRLSKFFNDNGYAKPGGVIPVPPLTPQYLIYVPEYINFRMWSVLNSLVFTTTALPINGEIQPAVVSIEQISTGATEFRSILTDFQPDLTFPGTGRTQLQYFPQGPYRLLDLTSTQPLRRVDIQVFWADRNNNLYPINLTFTESLSIKLLFIRKSTYKGDINATQSYPQSVSRGGVQYRMAY